MSKRKYRVGDIYPTNCGVDAQIIETEGFTKQRLKIKWLDESGHEQVVKSTHLSVGKVLNPFAKLNYGVGYLGVGEYKPSTHKKHYSLWASMFTRCFSEVYQIKKPTYVGCQVNPVWHCFQNFALWCDQQAGFGLKDYELDKDILKLGNKEYGPEFCRIVPNYMNSVLSSSGAIRGEWPLGVFYQKHIDHRNNPFSVQVKLRDSGKSRHLGTFNCPREAHRAWQEAKADHIYNTIVLWSKEETFDTEIACSMMSRVWTLRLNASQGVETLFL